MKNEDELKKARNQLGIMTLKAVWNSCWDHYTETSEYDERTHTHDHGKAYWKQRLGLTGAQSIDDYIMNLIRPLVQSELTEVDDIARKVKKSLGL